MPQTNIVIASVLKPLKDARSYYRFGISMRETNKYLINIIGFSTKKESDEKNIKFHSVYSGKRTGVSRLLVGWKFFLRISQIKPKLVIITTYELLPAAVLGKWILGYKLVYDLQENYALNLSQNKTMAGWKQGLAIRTVTFLESCARPFIDHYFFAEKVYQEEFPKINKQTVLENKYYGDLAGIRSVNLQSKTKLRFLLSGTLTEVYGILEGIEWFKSIQTHFPEASLTVIGHVPMAKFGEKLKKTASDHKSIQIHVSDNPIPYSDILNAYEQTDIVLLPYHQVPSISPKIPSKLYESIALGKPCLFQTNPTWETICSGYPAGKGIDFSDLNHSKEKFEDFLAMDFFVHKPGEEVLWKSDEVAFLQLIEKLSN